MIVKYARRGMSNPRMAIMLVAENEFEQTFVDSLPANNLRAYAEALYPDNRRGIVVENIDEDY